MSARRPRPEAQSGPSAAAASTPGPDGRWLYGYWYPALRSDEARGTRTATASLLGLPLLLGRTAPGEAFALRDSCPHRGIPLSYGRFDGREVECAYHGWRFEPRSGQCRAIPSLPADAPLRADRIYATAFPCREADGFFWVFLPESAAAGHAGQVVVPDLPEVPRVPAFSERFVLTHLAADLPVQHRPRHHRPHGPRPRALRPRRAGGGGGATASTRRRSTSSPSRRAFA